MIYDLSIPKKQRWDFPLPTEPKAKVLGINLLRTCRQIREETSDRVWYRSWRIRLPLPKQSDPSPIDLEFATSSMHELALAKISSVTLDIGIDPDDLPSCGLLNLEKLSSFKSSWLTFVFVRWGDRDKGRSSDLSKDPTKTTFLRGLVIQILLQAPPHLEIAWNFRFWGRCKWGLSQALERIAGEYKFLQGAHYERKVGKLCKEHDTLFTSEGLSVGRQIYTCCTICAYHCSYD